MEEDLEEQVKRLREQLTLVAELLAHHMTETASNPDARLWPPKGLDPDLLEAIQRGLQSGRMKPGRR